MTGTKKSVVTVARSSPPMTARPSGAFCSPPSPSPSDIGSMPMIIASAVMMTGRRRVIPAASAASRGVAAHLALIVGEGDDEDAVRGGDADAHDRPISAGTLSVVCDRKSIQAMPGDARPGAPSG